MALDHRAQGPAGTDGGQLAIVAHDDHLGPGPLRRLQQAGVERIMLQDFLPWDLDHIDVMGEVLVGGI